MKQNLMRIIEKEARFVLYCDLLHTNTSVLDHACRTVVHGIRHFIAFQSRCCGLSREKLPYDVELSQYLTRFLRIMLVEIEAHGLSTVINKWRHHD